MKQLKWIVVMAGFTGMAALAQSNLCSNGSFTSANDPLEGWNIHYEFTGSSVYMNNHNTISFVPEHQGRKRLLGMAKTYENKVETKLIPFEQGARYQCTLEVLGEAAVRVHFNGYNWRPGIAPSGDPQLKDMRLVYKGEAWSGASASWKTVTVSLPREQISQEADSHLKKVRFITVEVLVPAGGEGKGTYITNVKVTRIGTYKVRKDSGT